MSSTMNQIHTKAFSDMLIEAVQVQQSALEFACARKEIFKGEALFFNKIGTTELKKKDGTNQNTIFSDIANTRRKVSFDTFNDAVAINRFDTDRSTIVGLDTGYLNSLKFAAERKKEEIIVNAATGVAYEGKEGTTSVSFPDSTNTVYQDGTAGSQGTSNESGTPTGLIADKILQGLFLLRKNMKTGNIKEKIYCAISAEEELQLLQDNKIINRDYTAGQALDKGIVGSWLGVNFVRTELLRMPQNYVREVLLFTDQAIGLGLPGEVFLRAGENPERQYQNQMYIELNFGATRVEDEKIVKIRCKSLYKTDGTK
jgi:hypothetical protein